MGSKNETSDAIQMSRLVPKEQRWAKFTRKAISFEKKMISLDANSFGLYFNRVHFSNIVWLGYSSRWRGPSMQKSH